MSKFVKNLVQDEVGIKQQRASILAEETKNCQEDLVRDLQREKRNLETKLLNLTDLSPDNTYSLKPGGESFSAQKWVKEMQDTKVKLMNIDIELEVAQNTLKEWFGNEQETA